MQRASCNNCSFGNKYILFINEQVIAEKDEFSSYSTAAFINPGFSAVLYQHFSQFCKVWTFKKWIWRKLNVKYKNLIFFRLRNWVYATNSNFLINISSQPEGVNLSYFKLWLINLTEIMIWNISGLQYDCKNIGTWKSRVCDKDSIPFHCNLIFFFDWVFFIFSKIFFLF